MTYQKRQGNYQNYRSRAPTRQTLYALPFVGSYLYRYDKMQDDLRRHEDYRRNTGQDYAYASSGYGAQAYSEAGQLSTDAFRRVGTQYRRMV